MGPIYAYMVDSFYLWENPFSNKSKYKVCYRIHGVFIFRIDEEPMTDEDLLFLTLTIPTLKRYTPIRDKRIFNPSYGLIEPDAS